MYSMNCPSRRKTKTVYVGDVPIGSEHPISVQSMTNTPTTDIQATLGQIYELQKAGADIVRVSCPDAASTRALKEIVRQSDVPIIADIHFHYQRAIEAADNGAACLRFNPGNIGNKERVQAVVQAAKANNCSIRIGVNAGSLEKHILDKYSEPTADGMVESALFHSQFLYDCGFDNFKISVKASNVFLAYEAYTKLAKKGDFPLHLGITEAGSLSTGTVQSAMGIGRLLWEGIGDTIRVSLSANPVEEIRVGFEILKALNLRHRGVRIISCPSCARQGFDVIKTVQILEEKLQHIQEPITICIMGCVVNGPGESKHTDIGITGGAKGAHMMYVGGIAAQKITDEKLVDTVIEEISKKAKALSSA